MPSFAIFFEATVAAAMRSDVQADDGVEGSYGNDVPGIFRNDVSGKKVYLARSVGLLLTTTARCGYPVVGTMGDGDGLHLHPQEAGAGVNDEIVARVIAKRLGHNEAQGGRAPKKTHLRPLALAFAVARERMHCFFGGQRSLARLAIKRMIEQNDNRLLRLKPLGMTGSFMRGKSRGGK